MTFLSRYSLSLSDIRSQRLTDTYSLHRMVYSLFENVRGGNSQEHSGILFADKGGDARARRLLILSQRPPLSPSCGELETRTLPEQFLSFPSYRFEVIVNPVYKDSKTGKLVPLRTREQVAAWFCARAPQWGFAVREETLLVSNMTVDRFTKGEHPVTLFKANLHGFLDVQNNELFSRCVVQGLGRGRAFGCGLLQIVPAA